MGFNIVTRLHKKKTRSKTLGDKGLKDPDVFIFENEDDKEFILICGLWEAGLTFCINLTCKLLACYTWFFYHL